jgi:hypothetical protein
MHIYTVSPAVLHCRSVLLHRIQRKVDIVNFVIVSLSECRNYLKYLPPFENKIIETLIMYRSYGPIIKCCPFTANGSFLGKIINHTL